MRVPVNNVDFLSANRAQKLTLLRGAIDDYNEHLRRPDSPASGIARSGQVLREGLRSLEVTFEHLDGAQRETGAEFD